MKPKKEEPLLPPRATGIVLGVWVAVLLILAFVVVPLIFSIWAPQPVPSPAP